VQDLKKLIVEAASRLEADRNTQRKEVRRLRQALATIATSKVAADDLRRFALVTLSQE